MIDLVEIDRSNKPRILRNKSSRNTLTLTTDGSRYFCKLEVEGIKCDCYLHPRVVEDYGIQRLIEGDTLDKLVLQQLLTRSGHLYENIYD